MFFSAKNVPGRRRQKKSAGGLNRRQRGRRLVYSRAVSVSNAEFRGTIGASSSYRYGR